MRDHDSNCSVRSLLEQVQHLHEENTQESFRKALALARHAAKIAAPWSYDALLAIGFVAALASDFGFWKESERRAQESLYHLAAIAPPCPR